MNKLLVILLVFQGEVLAQPVKFISYYHVHTDTELHVNYFRIGGAAASFDYERNFYVNGQRLFSYPADSVVTYEVYRSRYLLVSFYPDVENKSALGPELKPKGRVDIYDLKKPGLKWSFDLKGMYLTQNIKRFNKRKNMLTVRKNQLLVKIKSNLTK